MKESDKERETNFLITSLFLWVGAALLSGAARQDKEVRAHGAGTILVHF